MSVRGDDVKKIAQLSHLDVSEEEIPVLVEKFNKILDWMDMLNEPDIEGVEPMASAHEAPARLRADEITDGGSVEDVLKNAPESSHGFFVVPKVVE